MTFKKFIDDLKNLVDIASSKGNYDYDPYMHGMANGLIVAQATATGEEPKFKDAPKKWLNDKKVKVKIESFLDERKFTGYEKDLFDKIKQPKFKVGQRVLLGKAREPVIISKVWKCEEWYKEVYFKQYPGHHQEIHCPDAWVYDVKKDVNDEETSTYDENQLTKIETLKEEWLNSYQISGKTVEVFLNPSSNEMPRKSAYRGILNIKDGQLYVWNSNTLHMAVGDKLFKDFFGILNMIYLV